MEGAMITKDVAKELGRLVGEKITKEARGAGCSYGMKPAKKRNPRRGKTVTKIAAAAKAVEKLAGLGLGTGLALGAMAAPAIGAGLKGAWKGMGRGLGSWLGLRQAGGGAGGGGYSGAGGKGGPLWGGHERAMFARMGFNPASYQQRERAMGDIAGGLGMQRRQAQAWQRMSRMPVF